jgi:protein phosphatase methylesterase 1
MMNDKIPVYIAGSQGHVFVCLHGAGHSALSFASLARQLKSQYIVVAFDIRGHGDHYCENETDLSETTLVNDTIEVMRYLYGLFPE